MNRNYQNFTLIVFLVFILASCGGNNLNKITFLSTTQASFTLEASEETPLEEGSFLWVDNIDEADNAELLIEDFNLEIDDINNIIPEDVTLTLVDEGANWRAIRTVRLYLYNEDESDSILMARLDTIPTNINAEIELNPNNESLRPYVIESERGFKFKTLLETRAQIITNYNYILTVISRVNGEI